MINFKLFASIALISGSASVMAGPQQIDVLGLVPGVSGPEAVRSANQDPTGLLGKGSGDAVFLEVGGHRLFCFPSYIEDKLSRLRCLTGNNWSKASSTQVFADLLAGFGKKFGKPDSATTEAVRTRAGVSYEKAIAQWIDMQGNTLSLWSLTQRIDEGLLLVVSAEQNRKDMDEFAAREAKKKF